MVKFILKFTLPLLILTLGIGVSYWLFSHPQKAKKRPAIESQALLIETGTPEFGTYNIIIEAMGKVIPALETTLKSRISGEILEVSREFIPGGFFKKNETILIIDPEDYKLSLQKQEALLKQATADYKLELGRQDIAKDELEIIARTTGKKLENSSLALRQPQLEKADSEVAKARSDLNVAKLNLRRTTIVAPFNLMVTSRHATLGDKISPSDSLATLVSTDEYWIETSVPIHNLHWLNIPLNSVEQGSPARVKLDNERGDRQGHLLKLTGSLNQKSRLAQLLVTVPDPLALADTTKGRPLILSDYVKILLQGKTLKDVVRIPLIWIREGSIVWVYEQGQLIFRPITTYYSDKTFAYIKSGIAQNDLIITSDISVPVEHMKLQTKDAAQQKASDKTKGLKIPKLEKNQ